MNNPDSPYGLDRANEYRHNPYLFDKKVKYFTKKYANPITASYMYNSWDFTYNINDDNENQNGYINIIFEMDGINRCNFQAKKNEKTKNIVLKYCSLVGIENKYNFYYRNSKRINLNKTLEENDIENDSLITVINTRDVEFF